MSSVAFAQFILLATVAIGITGIVVLDRLFGRRLTFSAAMVAMFLLIYPLSGVVYLSRLANSHTGYFDLRDQGGHAIVVSALVVLAGMVAFLAGAAHGTRRTRSAPQPGRRSQNVTVISEHRFLMCVLALLGISIWATLRVRDYAVDLHLARIIGLSNGMARYSYMSSWFVWAVSLTVLWMAVTRIRRGSPAIAAVLTVGLLLIVWSLEWNGGRSVIVLMGMPLLISAFPYLGKKGWLFAPFLAAGTAKYIISLSAARSFGRGVHFSDWLTWQWGRFSMVGFATVYAHLHGYVHGSALYGGTLNQLGGVTHIFGEGTGSTLPTTASIAGSQLLGNPNLQYIVPGTVADLYLAFGIVGVVAGYYLAGLFSVWTDRKFFSSTDFVSKLLFSFLGCVLLFRFGSGDVDSVFTYLVITGAPLFLIHIVSRRRTFRIAARSSQRASRLATKA